MATFTTGRETIYPTVTESLSKIIDHKGKQTNLKTYVYVKNHKRYSDTEVLITPHKNGVKITLPNYTDAHTIIDPDYVEDIKTATLSLVEEYTFENL